MLDSLLINQLEISSVRIAGHNEVVVGLSNKYSRKLMYIFIFLFSHPDIFPEFRCKTMPNSAILTVLELNKLRARVLQVIYCAHIHRINGGRH